VLGNERGCQRSTSRSVTAASQKIHSNSPKPESMLRSRRLRSHLCRSPGGARDVRLAVRTFQRSFIDCLAAICASTATPRKKGKWQRQGANSIPRRHHRRPLPPRFEAISAAATPQTIQMGRSRNMRNWSQRFAGAGGWHGRFWRYSPDSGRFFRHAMFAPILLHRCRRTLYRPAPLHGLREPLAALRCQCTLATGEHCVRRLLRRPAFLLSFGPAV